MIAEVEAGYVGGDHGGVRDGAVVDQDYVDLLQTEWEF